MEFKVSANYVLSKQLTIEADNAVEAMDKAMAMVDKPVKFNELTMTEFYFGQISPIKWMDEKRSKPEEHE